uniref:Uncharacterized protein n=2 Tax=Cucumis sativus TaxID=3659 RepID=A0A0A0K6V2_CUCSA
MVSTFLLLLLLIPSLKIIINGFNSLSTLAICLFLKAPPCLILSFLKAIKLPAEAFLSAFQSLGEALKSIFVSTIEMGFGIISSFVMGVLEAVMNVVFGSFVESSASAFGGLLENTKGSWEGFNLFEQVRGIIESFCEFVLQQVWEIATSFAGGMFEFTMTNMSTMFNEPGSVIGGLVETLKGSLMDGVGSWMEGVQGIVERLIEKMVNTSSEVANSSTYGLFEIVKTVFNLVVDSGYSVGGLVEKTRTGLEILKMEKLRGIIVNIAKISVNMVINYLFG